MQCGCLLYLALPPHFHYLELQLPIFILELWPEKKVYTAFPANLLDVFCLLILCLCNALYESCSIQIHTVLSLQRGRTTFLRFSVTPMSSYYRLHSPLSSPVRRSSETSKLWKFETRQPNACRATTTQASWVATDAVHSWSGIDIHLGMAVW